VEGTDDLLGLLLGYMRMGVGVRVGRGVIVIVIWMVMVRVIRVIVGSVRLRWRVSINMIVILDIWKSFAISIRLEGYASKGPIGESGKGAGGGRWSGEDKPHRSGLLSPPLPPTLPHANWPGGSTVR